MKTKETYSIVKDVDCLIIEHIADVNKNDLKAYLTYAKVYLQTIQAYCGTKPTQEEKTLDNLISKLKEDLNE